MMTTLDPMKVQDAYHYALAAAGDDNSVLQARTRRGRNAYGAMTRSQCLKAAWRLAKEAGLTVDHTTLGFPPVRRPKTLKDAAFLAADISVTARLMGVDAYSGEAIK